MKNSIKTITAILLSLSVVTAFAANLNPSNYPTDLMFQKKPVDPLCFFNLSHKTDKIELKNCGLSKNKYEATGKSHDLTKKGFYGFDWKDPSVSYPAGGYSYYKAWDAGKKQYWIYTINNGGGSGDFTAINLYSRPDLDTAMLKTIRGGDRCNGGIDDVKDTIHGIQYSVNLTAYDFLELAKDNIHQLKAYDDLSACATCCAAKAYYEVDDHLQVTLTRVDLGVHTNINTMSTQGKYQQCFNKIFSSYVLKGESKVDYTQLKQFVKEFNDKCI